METRHRTGQGFTRGPADVPDALQAAVSGVQGEVRFNASLRDFTSFKIGGVADVLVMPNTIDDVARLVRQARDAKVPVFVLGGTNLLVRDGGFRGVVVGLSRLKAIREEPDAILYAEGGVLMPALLRQAITRSLSGLEWAAGIPGTVAGCVVMNAGTRLGEMKDTVKAVRLVNPWGRIMDCPAASMSFAYRRTKLPRGIVVGVWVQLKPGRREQIEQTVKSYLRYRKETQPLTLPNAGCAFKNPPSDSAGRLIESVGLKGLRIGDAQVSEKHANFIINVGQARAADVIELIERVRRIVKMETGVRLELELKIVGEP
jgi:UDP-N-acetylmuramate dehydrogenase